jgi:hypothetical protein
MANTAPAATFPLHDSFFQDLTRDYRPSPANLFQHAWDGEAPNDATIPLKNQARQLDGNIVTITTSKARTEHANQRVANTIVTPVLIDNTGVTQGAKSFQQGELTTLVYQGIAMIRGYTATATLDSTGVMTSTGQCRRQLPESTIQQRDQQHLRSHRHDVPSPAPHIPDATDESVTH